MKPKILLTAGCSFSECINWYENCNPENRTWPIWLAEKLAVPHYSEAMGSQGNGQISRRTQYRLEQLLKTHSPEDLLVGIMWSGRDRFDFYFENPIEFPRNDDRWMKNPSTFVDGAAGGWVLLTPHWTHPYNEPWYKHYYDELGAQIYTLEHILNLQRYLQLKNIRYFMTSYTSATFARHQKDNPNIEWLWKQIDWDQFLPVEGEHDWVNNHYPIATAKNFHPRSWQHEKFVNEVIWPWLEQKELI